MKKKAIYFNQEFNTENPPKYAVCLTYDDVNGLQIVDDRKHILISTSTDINQNADIKILTNKINKIEEIITINDEKNQEVEKQPEYDINYFSAFEVMPTKVEISGHYREIPACTVHKFTLRSANPIENNDVVVDWGDGCIEVIADGKYEWIKNKQYNLEHDYAESMTENVQKFIVKIYGKNYYTFRCNEAVVADGVKLTLSNNLISRIFDVDLPMAPHISNFSSICYGALRLFSVTIPHSTKYITDGYNFSSTFQWAENLTSVMGFEDNLLRSNCHVSCMFKYCYSLIETDFTIPACVISISDIFYDCKKLSVKIENLLPAGGFALTNINMNLAFGNTISLTGTPPENLLWNSGKNFIKFNTSFRNSGVKNNVPDEWAK